MGIKSTTTLHRDAAVHLYNDLKARLYSGRESNMTNHELGNMLDELAELWAERNGTTCFDNYNVVDNNEPLDD